MKEYSILISLLFLLFVGCRDRSGDKTNTDTTNAVIKSDTPVSPIDSISGLIKITSEEVIQMSDNYKAMVTKDPSKAILIINLSTPQLIEYALQGEGMSFIMGASATEETMLIMEIYHENTETSYFYDASDIFKESMRGMRNRPVLCPPPTGCDIPLVPTPTPR